MWRRTGDVGFLARGAQQMSDWQPFSTIPKDGRRFEFRWVDDDGSEVVMVGHFSAAVPMADDGLITGWRPLTPDHPNYVPGRDGP